MARKLSKCFGPRAEERLSQPVQCEGDGELLTAADGRISLRVFNISGALVATLIDGWRDAGFHEVTVDARDGIRSIFLPDQDGNQVAVGKINADEVGCENDQGKLTNGPG